MGVAGTKFELVVPTERCVIWEYRAGDVSVVVLAYAFGQYRIQTWLYGKTYPDVIGPDC